MTPYDDNLKNFKKYLQIPTTTATKIFDLGNIKFSENGNGFSSAMTSKKERKRKEYIYMKTGEYS